MLVAGVTGGVATGKSLVTRGLRGHGAVTFSADEAARAVLSPHGETISSIRAAFGDAVFREDGALDRRALAAVVFRSPEALQLLSRVTHPPILRMLRAQIDGAAYDMAPATVIVVEAPLLFEAGLERWFDFIVVVACSSNFQLARAMARDAITSEEAAKRIESQWPLREKSRLADLTIHNNLLEDTERQIVILWRRLARLAVERAGPVYAREP
ncbi:MAG TPA: dephospho-CoA kinase [Chthonomonadales bacterium]|nr:dephospho-CoA kinase [Chthonomonadales bacterium]